MGASSKDHHDASGKTGSVQRGSPSPADCAPDFRPADLESSRRFSCISGPEMSQKGTIIFLN